MTGETHRILGYDFARGLAIIGMIFVNFKTYENKWGTQKRDYKKAKKTKIIDVNTTH